MSVCLKEPFPVLGITAPFDLGEELLSLQTPCYQQRWGFVWRSKRLLEPAGVSLHQRIRVKKIKHKEMNVLHPLFIYLFMWNQLICLTTCIYCIYINMNSVTCKRMKSAEVDTTTSSAPALYSVFKFSRISLFMVMYWFKTEWNNKIKYQQHPHHDDIDNSVSSSNSKNVNGSTSEKDVLHLPRMRRWFATPI